MRAPRLRQARRVVVGVEAREARQGEHLARRRIDGDDGAGRCLEGANRRRELALRDVLQPLVDARRDAVPGERALVLRSLGEQQPPRAIAQPAQLLDAAGELVVQRVLEAIRALAVRRHEASNEPASSRRG